MLRRLCWILLAAACAKDVPPSPASIQRNVSLSSLAGCPAVEAKVQESAVTEMRARLESAIQNRHRWGPVNFAGGAAGPSATPAPPAYTTTNLQVTGVDEADIVKNDGTRIRATPLSSWLPPAQRRLEGGAVVDVPYDCDQFEVGNAPVRLGFVTLATVDLDQPAVPPSRTTILGEVGLIYASQESLVLASPHYWWWDSDGNADRSSSPSSTYPT